MATKSGGDGALSPITLKPPGSREVVTEERANEFIEGWKTQLEEHREKVGAELKKSGSSKSADSVALCDSISLSDKSYTAAAAVRIASFLTRGDRPIARSIRSVDLSDVIAARMEEEGLQVLQILCDAFRESNLVEVNLSDNAMGSKGISACRSVLVLQAETLESLSLCNNGLSEKTMEEVADILTGAGDSNANICERLKKIHFFNNMSGDGGCQAFARILSRCTSALKDVRFSGTRAGRHGSLVVASALDVLGEEGVSNVERLDLADNTFGPEGATALSRALSRCRDLQYLNLRDCVLEDEGVGTICRSLWSSDIPLRNLDLSGNEMGRAGAKSLAEYLEENTTVQVLQVEENEITSLGVKYIARSLAGSAGEDEIGHDEGKQVDDDDDDDDDDDLNRRAAGDDDDDDDQAVAEPLVSTIEELRLGTNEVGKIGADALIQAYGPSGKNMPNLKTIHLDGNKFPKASVKDLKSIFGKKLLPMDDNDDEEDPDLDLDDDDEEDDEDDLDENIDGEVDDGIDQSAPKSDPEADKLADAMAHSLDLV